MAAGARIISLAFETERSTEFHSQICNTTVPIRHTPVAGHMCKSFVFSTNRTCHVGLFLALRASGKPGV